MKKEIIISSIAALSLAIPTLAQQRQFDIYGFTDFTVSRFFMEDNSPYKSLGYSDETIFNLSHVNTYFDFRPNNNTRALVELSFQGNPVNNRSSGSISTTPIPVKDIEREGEFTPRNSSGRPLEGLVYEWGSFSIERAWSELSINQYVNLRTGKFITPAGIWNVDHGSPVIITVKQPFQTGLIPIFPKSQYGLMQHGRIFVGDSDIDYSLTLSTGRVHFPNYERNDIRLGTPSDIAVGGNISTNLELLDGVKFGISAYTGMQRRQISDQLIDVSTGTPLNPDNHKYSLVVHDEAREKAFGLDAIVNHMGFRLQSELNIQHIDNYIDDDLSTLTVGFYTLLAYSIRTERNNVFTPYLMFERVKQEDSDDTYGNFFSGDNTGLPESPIEALQTMITGLNINIFNNYTIKIEHMYASFDTIGMFKNHSDVWNGHGLSLQLAMAF